MPFFDIPVPGWTVSSEPVAGPSTQKKRKRESEDVPQHNLEKLVGKLKRKGDGQPVQQKPKEKSAKNDKKKKEISNPMPLLSKGKKPSRSAVSVNELSPARPVKKVKFTHVVEDEQSEILTPLQKGMKEKLEGARFRIINESLYKSDSQEAVRMMEEDPEIFKEYHIGFRHQVQSWPTNPVEHYVSILSKYPPKSVIADLGCGDAALAHRLSPDGMIVLSFDLVSTDPHVVRADICSSIPLPGSEGTEDEKSEGEGQIVDVVVCALSLMGTNWPKCIREAWRILRPSGELKIAEVASRIEDVQAFTSLISSMGFKLTSKDDSNTHFTLFDFKKVPRKNKSEGAWKQLSSRGGLLKYCEYKRR